MRVKGKERRPAVPRLPHKLLIAGCLALIFGVVLMLRTTGYLPGLGALWPLPIMLVGLLLLYLAFFKNGHETYVFAGIFLTLLGSFVLLLTTVLNRVDVQRIWPLFMLFAGLSLLAYGFKKRGFAKVSLIFPALTLVILSLAFLPFSLGLVPISFRRFVLTWWPGLFVALGGFLILADFYPPARRRKKKPKNPSTDGG